MEARRSLRFTVEVTRASVASLKLFSDRSERLLNSVLYVLSPKPASNAVKPGDNEPLTPGDGRVDDFHKSSTCLLLAGTSLRVSTKKTVM